MKNRDEQEIAARTAKIQEELLQQAGGVWAVEEVADHLRLSPDAVEEQQEHGNLLAVEIQGSLRFPRCQFTDTGVVAGLGDVLRAIRTTSSWVKLSALLGPTIRIGRDVDHADDQESSVIEALAEGRFDEAMHAARSWGRQGAI